MRRRGLVPSKERPRKPAPVQNLAEEFGVHEIDLSEEWAALSEQLDITGGGTGAVAKGPEEFVVAPVEPVVAEIDESNSDGADSGAADSSGLRIADPEAEGTAANSTAETAGETSSTAGAEPVSGGASLMSGIDGVGAGAPDSVQAESEQILELSGPDAGGAADAPLLSADDFLNSLSGELDVVLPARHDEIPEQAAPSNGAGEEASRADIPEAISAEPPGPLTDVFDEFRAGLDESDNDEDPETHYNLGTAYREMGLVEESISEFQKVVQWMDREAAHHAGRGTADHAAAGKGRNGKRHVFRYPMQCYTLLGLAFMDKGESAIAAMWYMRALETPGLDQDSILALRYDLGVAQELAGDSLAARKSFSQVYGMNIDYRDVAERLAALGKG